MDILQKPDELTPQERIGHINEARRRILANESLSDDELAYAIKLMQSERKLSSSRTKAKPKKPAVPALNLSDF